MNKRSTAFRISQSVRLPNYRLRALSESRFLCVFPDLPNWLLLSEAEARTLARLSSSTVGEAARDVGHLEVRALLGKLLARKIIAPEGDIASIKQTGFLRLFFYLTNRCNLRCTYCYTFAGERKLRELVPRDWLRILRELADCERWDQVILSGGEPFLSPAFKLLVTHAKTMTETPLAIFTNGSYLRRFPVAFYNEFIDTMQISVDGPTADMHDAVRGSGHFDTLSDQLRVLEDYDGVVTFNMTITRTPNEEFGRQLAEFYRRSAERIKNVRLNVVTGTLAGRRCELMTMDAADQRLKLIRTNLLRSGVGHLVADSESPLLRRNVRRVSCGYGQTLAVSPTGDAFPCGLAQGVAVASLVGGSTARDVGAELARLRSDLAVERFNGCGECDFRYACGGSCRLGVTVKCHSRSSCQARMERLLIAEDAVFHARLERAESLCAD